MYEKRYASNSCSFNVFMPNGTFNALLSAAGLENLTVSWLVEEATAMNTIIFVNIWAGVGYYMVILLAGLMTISNDIYEEGGPNGLTNLPTTLMYQEAFKYDHYGAGSAIGIVILLICLAGTKLSELFPSVKEKA